MARPEWPADSVPVVEIAIEPKSAADLGKLRRALERLAAEDPDFQVKTDEESSQTILGGMGELHLDRIVDRLLGEFGIGLNLGAPQIAYRETITRTVEHDYAHKQQSVGGGEFARIKFRLEPDPPGGAFTFVTAVTGGNVPAAYIPAVEKGVRAAIGAGPIMGFPMIGVKFILLDGAYHDIDSSAAAFEAAGRAGVKEAIVKAGSKVLEPVMAVEITVPWECAGDVVDDLKTRRAVIGGTDGAGLAYAIAAAVPLANLFGYVNSLRSLTGGRGQFSMKFLRYERVPDAIDPDDPPFGGAMAMRA